MTCKACEERRRKLREMREAAIQLGGTMAQKIYSSLAAARAAHQAKHPAVKVETEVAEGEAKAKPKSGKPRTVTTDPPATYKTRAESGR